MAKRVFFSFHYDDVKAFRANVVRNHWLTKPDRESAGFFDASVWETAKRTGPDAVKRVINTGLKNTSVTVVLVGSETYDRRWVRYEIVKSMQRGNGLFGIHINGIRDRYKQTKADGPDPFEHLALTYNQEGTALTLSEWKNGGWRKFSDATGYSLKDQRPSAQWGNTYQLNKWYRVYDWTGDDGYNNFASWIDRHSQD